MREIAEQNLNQSKAALGPQVDDHLRKHHLRAHLGGSMRRCFLATSIVGREHASNWQWIF
jgi:hypothetical protein